MLPRNARGIRRSERLNDAIDFIQDGRDCRHKMSPPSGENAVPIVAGGNDTSMLLGESQTAPVSASDAEPLSRQFDRGEPDCVHLSERRREGGVTMFAVRAAGAGKFIAGLR